MEDVVWITLLKRLLKIIIMTGLILAVGYVVLKISYYIAPFIAAFVISIMIEPMIKFLIRRAKMGRKLASAISILFILSTLGGLIVILILKLIDEIIILSAKLPTYFAVVYTSVNEGLYKANHLYKLLPPEITNNIENVINNLSVSMMDMVNYTVKTLLNMVTSIPQIVLFIFVTMLSTYFITSDKERIYKNIRYHLPASWINKISSLKEDAFYALTGYIKTVLTLMAITFFELLIGFGLMRLNYVLLLAVVMSLVDILPVLGVGTALVPWIIYCLITGDTRLAVMLTLLYLVIIIVRQLIEPKILGYHIGIHPLITLMGMYVGVQLFGFVGLIFAPVTVILLKNIVSTILKNKSLSNVVKDL